MTRFSPTARRVLAVASLLLAAACNRADDPRVVDAQALVAEAERVVAQIDGALELSGIERPVEVLRDRWGIAHIYAQTQRDLFFAQGLVAAQDRLWQMEWWRRYGEGSLAEILGPAAVPHDRFARLLRFRGDLEAEYTSYHPDGREIMTAFAAGVNAWIDWAAERDALPVEFRLTGIEPRHWSPEVPLLRMAGLSMTGNNLREIDLALRVRELGVEAANARDNPDPWNELRVPDGLAIDLIPEDFRALTLGATLPAPELLPRFRGLADLFEPQAGLVGLSWPTIGRAASRLGVAGRQDGDGSNNWVVSGSMSATGAPLLANDPHRSITLPSLRYMVHLNAPGWNVIGAGEPALPGVAIGHNEDIGWGLTIVGIDQGDIFVERLNPDGSDQVWHGDGWEDLVVVQEEIVVRGEAPRTVPLKFSHHGPILWEDRDNNLAYAFKTVLTEPGTAGYLGSLRLDQAADWEQYVEAVDAWKVPSENLVYADREGNIGWVAAGLTPVREGWVGRLPVPGDGRFEWKGFRPTGELPQEFNPARGYIATANHNIMPEGYSPPLGYRWGAPTRYERIRDVLEDGDRFGVEDFKRLQYDVYSPVAARRMLRMVDWRFPEQRLERARAMLVAWDAVMGVDSAAAALYKGWESQCRTAGLDPDAVDEAAAAEALAAAIAVLEGEQGADPSAWRWGAANRLSFAHSLADTFDLPAVERPGDSTTVNVGARAHGASFREILDVADWDRSVATNTPGQSAQPRSPFYRNLRRAWVDGDYFPLLYTRAAVLENTAHRLLLLRRSAPGE